MKIRNGFVSNSSSSSFVVKYRVNNMSGPKDTQDVLLTKKQLKALKEYGFQYTKAINPYFVDTPICPWHRRLRDFTKWDDINLGMSVTCNQDEVIYFLLMNNVPFVGLCHYDQELVVWDGECDTFVEMPNLVESFSRGIGKENFKTGFESLLEQDVKEIKIKEWLDKERAFVSSLV